MSKQVTRKRNLALLIALVLTVTVVLASCGGSGKSSSSEGDAGGAAAAGDAGEKIILRTGGVGADPTRVDTVQIGIEKGFFAEEGIEIQDVGAIDVPQIISALTSGQTDFAGAMNSEALMAIDNGAPIIGVAGSCVTSETQTHMVFVVPKGSDITSIADLKGKRVVTASTVGGCTAGFPLEAARQGGAENAIAEVELLAAPEDVLIETLLRGDADVAGVHLIPEQIKTLYPEVEILFTDFDILGDTGGSTAWFFTKEFVENNPQTIEKFVRAIAKTNNWVNENNEESIEIFKEKGLAVNADLVWVAYYAPDAVADPAGTQLWLDLFGKPGQVQELKNKDLTVEDIVTNKYNEKA
ncbi:MAG: ABC transporter substrate-binding protein [Clostridiales Family XIII bacterium]|nr:ABC transporter substrate-binding protein [Clostridiales Family XIII bacterium]